MKHFVERVIRFTAGAVLLMLLAQPALAQGGGGNFFRLFGEIQTATLAQLEEVATALNLDDGQKAALSELNEELNADRFQAFQDGAGDWDAIRKDTSKLYAKYDEKVYTLLQGPQQKRAEEIFVQVNGPTALTNDRIANKIELSEEQRTKLNSATIEHFYDVFDSFQDFQDMTDEERAKATSDLIESRDKNLLAVLSDEQKTEFEDLKGEELEVDLSKLPFPGQQ